MFIRILNYFIPYKKIIIGISILLAISSVIYFIDDIHYKPIRERDIIIKSYDKQFVELGTIISNLEVDKEKCYIDLNASIDESYMKGWRDAIKINTNNIDTNPFSI